MKVSKQTAMVWRKNIERYILLINKTLGDDLTGENFLKLEFRGKSHRPVLFKDFTIVASGMFAINDYIYFTLKYYHMI